MYTHQLVVHWFWDFFIWSSPCPVRSGHIMEFEGGMYYLNKLSKNYKFYECKHYKLPQSGRVKKGYYLFASEIKLQLIEENRGCSYQEIIRLTGMAWRALPPERRDYYDRRAKVHRPQMMYGRCPGRLRFREVNGEMLTTVNELIDYAPHREELSIEISRWVKRVSIRNRYDLKINLLTELSFRSPTEGANSIQLTLDLSR